MPLIAETWRDSQVANLTTTGVQANPNIIQLANGNILVSWTTNDPGGFASPDGDDILGQIFDPLGNRVGVEFRINDFVLVNNEREVDMAALPGGGVGSGDSGGFLAVYEQSNISTGVVEICIDQKSADGVAATNSFVVSDGLDTDPNYRNPHVAVSSSTSALVVYEEVNGGASAIRGKIYNPSTGVFGGQISLLAFPGGDTDADVTTLTNGNYVITTTFGGADRAIGYRIITSTGSNILGATRVTGTDVNAEDDREASVTALAGGGFVISWTNTDLNDTDTLFRVYNAAGAETASGLAGEPLSTNNNNESVVTGLADGTFVIVYANDETSQLVIDHFSAAGIALGRFSFAGVNTAPTVTSLADGRLAVAWSDINGEISMEILDTRDAANSPAVYTPVSQIIGTIGDDVFTANAAFSFGYGGDDTITVIGVDSSETANGGDNVDTLVGSAMANGTHYNLAAGLMISGLASQSILNFENVTGTNADEQFTGTTGRNILIGGGGNDTLNGLGGIDSMRGGAGNDTYYADNSGDTTDETGGGGTGDYVYASVSFTAAAGIERLYLTGAGSINATGRALQNDILVGNAGANIINGLSGNDVMRGGLGNDTYYVDAALDTTDEVTGGGGTGDYVYASVSFTAAAGIERLYLQGIGNINATGRALQNDILVGNAGNNILDGLSGNDVMRGGLGNDIYYVDSISDSTDEVTSGGGAGDFVYSSVTFTAAQGIERLYLTGSAAINGTGRDAQNDILGGNSGANVLSGLTGSDVLIGGLGNDTLSGGAGLDIFRFDSALNAATNMDTVTDFVPVDDLIQLENAIFTALTVAGTLAAGAFNTGTAATQADDRIIYNSATGALIYDADGLGGVAGVQFALLSTHPAGVSAADFLVY